MKLTTKYLNISERLLARGISCHKIDVSIIQQVVCSQDQIKLADQNYNGHLFESNGNYR